MKNSHFVGIDVAMRRNVATIKDLKTVQETFAFDNTDEGFAELMARVPDPLPATQRQAVLRENGTESCG